MSLQGSAQEPDMNTTLLKRYLFSHQTQTLLEWWLNTLLIQYTDNNTAVMYRAARLQQVHSKKVCEPVRVK